MSMIFVEKPLLIKQQDATKQDLLFLELVGKKIIQWLNAEKTVLYNDTLDNTPANVKAMGIVPLRIYHSGHVDVFQMGAIWLDEN